MTDILIRGISPDALARIDAHAAALGLSRNEYLRRRLDAVGAGASEPAQVVSSDDVRRAVQAASDLDSAEVMSAAWR